MIKPRVPLQDFLDWLVSVEKDRKVPGESYGQAFLEKFFPGHVDHRLDHMQGLADWKTLHDTYIEPADSSPEESITQ